MREKNKTLVIALAVFLLCFYAAIVLYVFLGVIHIHMLHNFVTGMIFEAIGFAFLVLLVLGNIISHPIKTGYFVPIVIATVCYTILLDVLNIVGSMTMISSFFTLLHMILLFVYCLVFIPMYIMGKR